ncbi:MAG TPA: SusC/RagA family TonB-linked outer membrane protein [Gemmatimonadaceae bacterium]|nr:SusC/RagA family TonB-linked outer membrane protein [Gemmatimonadaceae bacterium]
MITRSFVDVVARRVALALLAASAASGTIQAQGAATAGSVSGTVTDRLTGRAVPSAQIIVVGTGRRAVTNDSGRFTVVDVGAGAHTVEARRIGYVSQRASVQVAAGATATLAIVLEPAALRLQQVVVTGVTDPIEGVKNPLSIGRLGEEDISSVPSTNSALGALQGKVAGASIIRSSGQPGVGVNVLLRTPIVSWDESRQESPMLVVDGVILSQSFSGTTVDLEALDIESIEVVKGAAAASLYGSRAAAGVIAITTKRGRGISLGQTKIGVRTEYGRSAAPTDLPITRHHHFLTNAEGQFVDTAGRPLTLAGQRVVAPDRIMDNSYGVPLYDNVGAFFQPGQFTTQQVSIGQNYESTNFLFTVNNKHEGGSLENNEGYTQRNFRVNLDHRVRDLASFSLSAFHNRGKRDDLSGDPFFDLLLTAPDVDIGRRGPNGEYLQVPDPTNPEHENPIWRQASRDNYQERTRTLASTDARLTPLGWLTLAGNFSYDRSDLNEQVYIPKGTPTSLTADIPSDGSLEKQNEFTDALNGSVSATLLGAFGQFTGRTTLRALMERERNTFVESVAADLVVEGVPTQSGAATVTPRSTLSEIRSNGYMAQTGLDYAGKYIVDALARRDGSSLFGSDARWNNYYRAAGAWRVSQEPFWKMPAVNEFKLRYAIGTAGGRPSFADQYETWTISTTGSTRGVPTKGTLGNRNLQPSRTTEREMGVDFIVANRYSAELTYARQTTTDQIISVPLPAISGYSSRYVNTGEQQGHTYEATLQARFISRQNLNWTSTFVADRSRSRITEWNRAPFTDELQVFGPGTSVSEMYGEHFLRRPDELATRVGDRINEFTVNDDGYLVWVGAGNHWQDGLWGQSATIDNVSYQFGIPIRGRDASGVVKSDYRIGNSLPNMNFGWLNNVGWKGLTLHTHLHTQFGGDVYNGTRQRMYQHMRHRDLDQSGKPAQRRKPIDYYQAIYNGNLVNDAFVEPGGYLKLRELSATYTFSRAQISRLGLARVAPEGMSFGIIGRNLYTWTRYSGFDPEVGSVLERYDEFDYPNTRTLTGVFEITF